MHLLIKKERILNMKKFDDILTELEYRLLELLHDLLCSIFDDEEDSDEEE